MNSSFRNILQHVSCTDISPPPTPKFSLGVDWFLCVISIWLQYSVQQMLPTRAPDWVSQWLLVWWMTISVFFLEDCHHLLQSDCRQELSAEIGFEGKGVENVEWIRLVQNSSEDYNEPARSIKVFGFFLSDYWLPKTDGEPWNFFLWRNSPYWGRSYSFSRFHGHNKTHRTLQDSFRCSDL